MQFNTILLAVAMFAGASIAQGGTCFDAGDCILSGGGACVVPSGSILGSCVKSTAAPTGTATATAPSSTSTAGGAICFDAGDCILSGGGQCIKAAGAITGNCS